MSNFLPRKNRTFLGIVPRYIGTSILPRNIDAPKRRIYILGVLVILNCGMPGVGEEKKNFG